MGVEVICGVKETCLEGGIKLGQREREFRFNRGDDDEHERTNYSGMTKGDPRPAIITCGT